MRRAFARSARNLARGVAPVPESRPGSFPRQYAAASLKHWRMIVVISPVAGFPRQYAAASLKGGHGPGGREPHACFPRLYAAASLKAVEVADLAAVWEVFRGSMPRPH